MSGTTTAIMCDCRVRRLRATMFGRYPSSRIAFITVPRVATATARLPDNTWETVVGLTPARLATCEIVTRERWSDAASVLDMAVSYWEICSKTIWGRPMTDLVERFSSESLLLP